MKTKRIIWTVVFLGLTLAAIVMEVVAGVFHPAGTIPWTEYIAQYVPWPIQLGVYVALAAWLPFHFWRADVERKAAFTAGVHEGQAAAKASNYAAGADPFLATDHARLTGVRRAPLDLVADEELADALRRRGWSVERGR